MGKKEHFTTALFALFVCLTFYAVPDGVSADVFVRQNRAEALYGQGVHAFFDNDFQESTNLLLKVEELGSEDPRPYYFLALSYLRMEDDQKAEEYFRKAAKLEWEGRSFRDYNVSDALRRIQGKERLYIEMFRSQAKREWQQAETRRLNEMYKREEVTDTEVMTSLSKRFVGTSLFGARSVNPFGDDPEEAEKVTMPNDDEIPAQPSRTSKPQEPAGEARTGAAKPVPAPTPADPFADDNGDESDPFGSTPTPAPKKSNDADDDPFADDEDGDDPFSTPTQTPKKVDNKKKSDAKDDMDDDPFADDEDGDEDDPFGTPTPTPKKVDDEKKSDAENDVDDDPFADDEKDDDDNPFN